MLVHRNTFFLLLALIVTSPWLPYRAYWMMHSKKTTGIFSFAGKGATGEAIKLSYSVIYFKLGKDTIWFEGLGNLRLREGATIPVRYQTGNPSDARVGTFTGLWGDVVVYGGSLFLVVLALFVHRKVVPYRAKLLLTRKKPYIRIIEPMSSMH